MTFSPEWNIVDMILFILSPSLKKILLWSMLFICQLIEEDEITDSPMRDGSCKVEDMDIDDEFRSQSDNTEAAVSSL